MLIEVSDVGEIVVKYVCGFFIEEYNMDVVNVLIE